MKNFLICMVCVICFGIGFFFNTSSPSKTDRVLQRIDSVFIEREHYILDTVNVKVKSIKYIHDTQIEYVERVFESDNNAEKISMFELYYPANDSDSLMVITEGQAVKAISKAIDHERDSTLMETYKKSSEDCDERLDTIKSKVDTLKVEIKSDVDSASKEGFYKGLKTSGIIAAAIAGLYILLGVK